VKCARSALFTFFEESPGPSSPIAAMPRWGPHLLGAAFARLLRFAADPSDEDQRRRVIRTGFGVAAVGFAGLLVALPWGKRLRAERDVATPCWQELRKQRRALDAEIRASAGPTSFGLTLSGRF
jgi:hypothetical protein